MKKPTLTTNEVHVWNIDLNGPLTGRIRERLESPLDACERNRASRFHFERDREAYIRSHGALRIILASYLSNAPERIGFIPGAAGKPEIIPSLNCKCLRFNLSHTRGLALIAVVRERAVGIDVEHLRPIRDFEQIARRFFTSRESEQLSALPASERKKAFYRLWTRKEAYLKATGEGISNALNRIEITLLPNELARILSINGDLNASEDWSIYPLKLPDEFEGALVMSGSEKPLKQFHFCTEDLMSQEI